MNNNSHNNVNNMNQNHNKSKVIKQNTRMNQTVNMKQNTRMDQTVNKKQNYRMDLMYDGSEFNGWQRLTNENKKKSIQSCLEEVLSSYLNEDIKLIGSGRTDKGVHALNQVANFYCKSLKDTSKLKDDMNQLLPTGLVITNLQEVNDKFHARFDVKSKTYEYRIQNNEVPSVFLNKYTYEVNNSLNLEKMREGASYLIGTHDFSSFATKREDVKSSIRTIYNIDITQFKNNNFGRTINEIRVKITGNGFLYNMVRIIVGTLLEIGEGKRNPKDIIKLLENKERSQAGPTIYGNGLFLVKVDYE